MFVTTTSVAIAGFFAAARADSDPPTRVVGQDTVVVTASKVHFRLADLATSASVISARQLKLGTARNLQDAFAFVPGAHVLDLSGSETQGALEARGFASQGTSSHVLVLLDDIPINDLEGDRVDWNLLAKDQVERIEFLRGPASFLYGDASMAGVVDVITHRAGEAANFWAQGTGGTQGRAGGAAGVTFPGTRVDFGGSGAHQVVEGFRDHSQWGSSSGHGFVHAKLGDRWTLRARLLGHRADQDLPGPLPDPTWRDDPQQAGTPLDHHHDKILNGAIEAKGVLADGLEAVTIASEDVRDIDATETIIPVGTMNRTSRLRSGRVEARLHWTPANLPIPHLLLGGDLQSGTVESRYHDPAQSGLLVGAGDVHRKSGGLFSLVQVGSAQGLTVTGGVRIDWLRSSIDDPTDALPDSTHDDMRAFSPTAAVNYVLPNSGNVFVSYQGSFKAPALEQLYDRRPYDLGFGPLRISRNTLQPQRGHHGEIGARTPIGSRARVEAAAYYARSKDEIGFDLANFSLSNIDKSIHYGFEGQVSADLASRWSGQVSYAYTRATFDGGDHDGKQINTVPEHQLSGRVTFDHPWNGSVTLEGVGVFDQWIDEDNHVRLPDYALANVGVRQALGPFEVFGSVRNLFDRRYASLGYVTVDLTGADLPLYFPGAQRSFYAGLRYGATFRATERTP